MRLHQPVAKLPCRSRPLRPLRTIGGGAVGFRRAAMLVAALALLTTVLWMAAAVAQASSPASGQIAFVRDGNIWIMESDGSGQRQLTWSSRDELPAWSPDGSSIAFVRGTDEPTGEIHIINVDGTQDRQVPFPLGLAQMPGTAHEQTKYRILAVAWSPDGSDLAVAGHANSDYPDLAGGLNESQLFFVHPDGASQRRIGPLLHGWTERLSWRSDGAKLLLTQYYIQGASSVKAIDVGTRSYTNVQGQVGLTFAEWSQDGTSIAAGCPEDQLHFAAPVDLVVFKGLSGQRVNVTRPDTDLTWPRLFLSWSSDGKWLAYAIEDGLQYEGHARPILELVASSGGDVSSLAYNADQPAWRPTGSPPAPKPLVVLIGGLGSKIPASGGDWTFVKQRLEKAGYKDRVFVAKTHPGLPPGDASDVIDSKSPDWRDSAARLDHQLSAAGYKNRDLVLVGHSMGGLIARVYAANWEIPGSGCRPLGIVQLGTPNKGSKAANLAIGPLKSEAADRLADDASMAAFNAEFPNAEALPIYRIAGSYFPKSAGAYVAKQALTPKKQNLLAAVLGTIVTVYGTAYNDSVVTVDSVRGGPTAGWQGCTVFKAAHANSGWLLAFREDCGCVLPRRSGKKGAAAIDEKIMQKIIEDVRGVEKSAAVTLPFWLEAPVVAHSAGSAH